MLGKPLQYLHNALRAACGRAYGNHFRYPGPEIFLQYLIGEVIFLVQLSELGGQAYVHGPEGGFGRRLGHDAHIGDAVAKESEALLYVLTDGNALYIRLPEALGGLGSLLHTEPFHIHYYNHFPLLLTTANASDNMVVLPTT